MSNKPKLQVETELKAAQAQIAQFEAELNDARQTLSMQIEIEERLRESEELLRMAYEATDLGVWKNDLITGAVFFDAQARLQYDFDQHEVTLADVMDRIHPEDAAKLRQEIAAATAATGSGKFATDYRVIHRDGSVHWLSVGVRVIFEGQGEQRRAVIGYGTSLDITERKKGEEDLKQSEERFSTAFFTSPVAQSIITVGTNEILEVNDACCRLFEYSREELIGASTAKLNLWHDPAKRLEALDELKKTGRLLPREVSTHMKSGTMRTVIAAIEPISWQGIPCLISFVFDITDRKQAEETLRRSEERFRQIAETIQEVFWVFDNQQQRLLYVSPAIQSVWGRSMQEFDDLNNLVVDVVFPADRSLIIDMIERQNRGEPTDSELRILHVNGEIHWIHLRSFPVLDTNGTLVRTTGIAADITNRKQAEQEAIYRQELLEKVIQLGKKITAIIDLETCLFEIYQGARFGLGFDRVGLFLYDEELHHILGVYGTSRTGEIEEPGFFDGPLTKFGNWERALQSPIGLSWLDDYQAHFDVPEGHTMYGVREHATVAAWAGDKPVALITVDNLLSGRKIKPPELEALQLFAGYAGLAIENASLHTELEMKVEERTAEVQDLYENAPTGYHSIDVNGRIIQINQTELGWLGYTKEEVLGHPLDEFITEQSRLIFQEHFPRFKEKGVVRDVEIEMVRKDGSTFPALVNATAIRDGRGNYIMSRSTIFDNTEHKHAEDALRQSEETYRALFENANDGIFIFGLDRSILRVNPKGAELLGYPAEALIGAPDEQFLESEYIRDAEQRAQRITAGEHVPVYERKLRKRDGSWLETEINLSLIRDASGNPQFIQSVVRDVSTRKRAEETLRLANIELERALRLKDEFLASMSHELRTPLTGILGLSEALQYDTYGEMNPKQKKVVANIENNGHHLLDLINDILDISKMEAGKLELEMVPCSLDDICRSSLQLVQGMAHKKGQHLSFSTNRAGIIVQGDARRLKQVIVNLLSNAVKYSPEGKPVGLDIAADPSTETVKIDIWDQGLGIMLEDLERLFQPFVQLDSSLSRQQSGTGLGLALVQRLVDLHGGSIQVESSPGVGSRFSVTLPHLGGTSEPREEEPREALPHIQQSLIVEDSTIDANRLSRFLKILGIHAMVETQGKDVVEKALTSRPGVILLDINLPDMTGWDVLKQLKENEATRSIPVVITSVVEERERANKLGAAGYLLKLFTLDELRSILSRIPKPANTHNDKALVISSNVQPGVVMIVDDNETNVLMLEDFLRSRDYKVFSSHSGFDFLDRVANVRPDMVLMDIQMPDMDGLETIRRLRALPDPELAATPVIAITALAMPGDRERCLEAGAHEYISKPVQLKALVALIRKMLLDQEDPGS